MLQLTLALTAFVGTHFLMSHPLRAALVARLGAGGFLGFYSLVSFATLGWAAYAFWQAPLGYPVWQAGEGLWVASTAIMFVASVLFVGSLIGNPALPAPGNEKLTRQTVRGVFAISRHPMMWAFALWSLSHVLVSPRPAVIQLCGAIAVLALGGAAGQDYKKIKLVGSDWRDWMRRTSFVPFGGQAAGSIGWAIAWPGRTAMVGGTLLWLAATWAHPWAGAPVAGVWYWIS